MLGALCSLSRSGVQLTRIGMSLGEALLALAHPAQHDNSNEHTGDCERFFRCLVDRIEKGHQVTETTEADRRRVDISGSFQGLSIYGCSSHEDARQFVAEAAASCGLDWEKHYRKHRQQESGAEADDSERADGED
jgi:hypothetical protein